MTPTIFDSHAHYDDPAFDPDRDELLAALPARGVGTVVNAASDLASAARCMELAAARPWIYAAVGIHPEAADTFGPGSVPALREMAAAPGVVAIGEIGLDNHWPDNPPKETQIACFEAQLQLAKELDLPVVIHCRDALEEVLRLLRIYRPAGVMHCFPGSVETMKEVLDLGLYIGLGGAVTFRNAKRPVAVAAAVPADRLLLETDAPYMAPVPCRGMRCDSSMIAFTAAFIAGVRGITREELLAVTAENGRKLFRIQSQ